MDNFKISNNFFNGLPDLTSLYYEHLRFINIKNNNFTFEDIEPNLTVPWLAFGYSPQDSVLNFIDTLIQIGNSVTLTSLVGGTQNKYQWKKNGNILLNDTNSSLTLNNIQFSDSGIYTCDITNTLAAQLTLHRKLIKIRVVTIVPSYSINGNINYFNTAFTPMDLLTVSLISGTTQIATTSSNANDD